MHSEEERRYTVMHMQRRAMVTELPAAHTGLPIAGSSHTMALPSTTPSVLTESMHEEIAPPPPPPGLPPQNMRTSLRPPPSVLRSQRATQSVQFGDVHGGHDPIREDMERRISLERASFQSTFETEDTSASLAWLSTPRVLQLRQRNSSRSYEFSVVPGSDLTEDPQRNSAPGLVWFSDGKRVGFLLMSDAADIRRISKDPCSFVILLRPRNPLAVKSTGGLREVCIKASTPSECGMYVNGIQSLLSG